MTAFESRSLSDWHALLFAATTRTMVANLNCVQPHLAAMATSFDVTGGELYTFAITI